MENLKDKDQLKYKIIECLSNSLVKELTILVDCEYLLDANKLIFVKLERNEYDLTDLKFYTKKKVAQKDAGVTIEEPVSFSVLQVILNKLLTRDLYNVHVPGNPELSHCAITVCTDMNLLILESHLYRATREMLSKPDGNYSFMMGGSVVPATECKLLRDAFKQNAFKVYRDLIFSRHSRKFIARIRRNMKGFYSIQNTFIPVFINYSKVYNPLNQEPALRETQLYKTAVEKNRVVERGALSCYLLTHLEICKALGMSNFMRFTPSFLYDVYVGLLFPNDKHFPAVNRNVFVRPKSDSSEETNNMDLKAQYDESEFEALFKKLYDELQSGTLSESSKKRHEEKLKKLQSYVSMSSLRHACAVNHHYLATMGSIALDNDKHKTVDAYFGYLKEARII